MKKIIILVLALVIIAAIYFLFIAEKEKPIEEPVNGFEAPAAEPVELPLYPGAEFVMRKIESSGDVSFYAVNAPPHQVAEFYTAMFPDFTIEEDPVAGYQLYNDKALSLAEELQHRSKFMDWKKTNKGLVLAIGASIYNPAEEYYQEPEEYREKIEGKTVIAIAHL